MNVNAIEKSMEVNKTMNELKTKCKALLEDLEEVRTGCYVDGIPGKPKDVRSSNLHDAVVETQRGLLHILDTINAYYTK